MTGYPAPQKTKLPHSPRSGIADQTLGVKNLNLLYSSRSKKYYVFKIGNSCGNALTLEKKTVASLQCDTQTKPYTKSP
jgi:hypothetical protein